MRTVNGYANIPESSDSPDVPRDLTNLVNQLPSQANSELKRYMITTDRIDIMSNDVHRFVITDLVPTDLANEGWVVIGYDSIKASMTNAQEELAIIRGSHLDYTPDNTDFIWNRYTNQTLTIFAQVVFDNSGTSVATNINFDVWITLAKTSGKLVSSYQEIGVPMTIGDH